MKFPRWIGMVLLGLVILLASDWAFGALTFDGSGRGFAIINPAAEAANNDLEFSKLIREDLPGM